MAISKEEWSDWKSNKVTKEYLQHLNGQREDYKEHLVEGRVVEVTEQDVIIGRCQGIKDSIDFALSWNNMFSVVGDIND